MNSESQPLVSCYSSHSSGTSRATASILVNVSMIGELGQLWGSQKLQSIASGLESSSTDANVGQIKGNRMFYANDYMVCHEAVFVSRRPEN